MDIFKRVLVKSNLPGTSSIEVASFNKYYTYYRVTSPAGNKEDFRHCRRTQKITEVTLKPNQVWLDDSVKV